MNQPGLPGKINWVPLALPSYVEYQTSDKRNRNPNWTDAEITRFLSILLEEPVLTDLNAQRNKQVGEVYNESLDPSRVLCTNNTAVLSISPVQCCATLHCWEQQRIFTSNASCVCLLFLALPLCSFHTSHGRV